MKTLCTILVILVATPSLLLAQGTIRGMVTDSRQRTDGQGQHPREETALTPR
jgi:hypothetical protein